MTLLMFMEGQLIKLPIYTVSCSHISGKFQFSCSTCTLGLQVQCRSSQLHISHKTCIQLCIDGLFYSGSILKQSLFLCPSSSTHRFSFSPILNQNLRCFKVRCYRNPVESLKVCTVEFYLFWRNCKLFQEILLLTFLSWSNIK